MEIVPTSVVIKSSHYFIGGIALVAALSWNTFVKDAIANNFPIAKDNLSAELWYAIVMTIILVIAVYLLPSTTSELPADAQARIKAAEDMDKLRLQVANLEGQIAQLQKARTANLITAFQ